MMNKGALSPALTRWAVIGAGPCGAAAVGKLCDGGFDVTWVDSSRFQCGRMGRLYRNVPANTPAASFVASFRSSPSLSFDAAQARRKRQHPGRPILTDLSPGQCPDLGLFVDALEDSVCALREKVRVVDGTVVTLHSASRDASEWTIGVRMATDCRPGEPPGQPDMALSVDAVILCTGSRPRPSPVRPAGGAAEHHIDVAVDPTAVAAALRRTPGLRAQTWAVVGNSHSGMLAIKNLIESGVKRVVNIYRSEIRYFYSSPDGHIRHQGSGLKGPVAEWAKRHVICDDGVGYRWGGDEECSLNFVDYTPGMPWEQQLHKAGAQNVVFALGFERDVLPIHGSGAPSVYVSGAPVNVALFDGATGKIGGMPNLFGAGIAFPHDYANTDGHIEPWVGFGFGVRNAQKIIDNWNASKREASRPASPLLQQPLGGGACASGSAPPRS